jgi:aspartate carbamoyltransferase catalytic subunit
MTIRRELGRLDNLVIGLVGDLKNGRTVHSLVEMVGKNFGVKELIMVSPPSLRMPESVLTRLPTTISVVEETSLSPQIMQRVDVLYCTRLQKERFGAGEAGLMDYDAAKSSLVVNAKRLVDAKQNMIVMHPLPRNDELSDDVDGDHRAAYFKQMRYGLLMRMALLYSVLA